MAGLAFFGAASGVALHGLEVPLRLGEVVAVLAVDASLAAMLAILLPLRRARVALVVAGLAGAVGAAAFFAATLLLRWDAGMGVASGSLPALLGLAPMVAALISMGGAAYLARGVRHARVRSVRMVHGR